MKSFSSIMRLSTLKQGRVGLNPMESVRPSTRPLSMSSTGSRLEKGFIGRWKNYREILTNGWSITIITVPIKENVVRVEHRCRHSLTVLAWLNRRIWTVDSMKYLTPANSSICQTTLCFLSSLFSCLIPSLGKRFFCSIH